MVHVLTDVLRKVHKSLRTDGSLLIIQPAPVNAIIELAIKGNVEFSEELKEPNFDKYLEATRISIHNVLTEQLFVIEHEATTPDEGLYHCNEYNSLDEWIEAHRPSCEDLEAFDEMSAKIRNLARGRDHRISKYWREYKILLRKSQPEYLEISPSPITRQQRRERIIMDDTQLDKKEHLC